MPPDRNFSITLPRNFQFHYMEGMEGQFPRTPEPESRSELIEPPRLPRQAYRVRRRRKLPSRDINADTLSDMPIPTIEEHPAPAASEYMSQQDAVEGLLQPAFIASRFVTPPPKTPVSQMSKLHDTTPCNAWDDVSSLGDSISRPSSACSTLSDSSSFSFQSYGGSCTSPESECADPFVVEPKQQSMLATSPLDRNCCTARPGKQRKTPKASFTAQMDHHLWLTYMQYLQNATVTPFKMLPGVAPPQGVCARVAREAKRTWRGPRDASKRSAYQAQRHGSPDTVKDIGSGSSTPTVTEANKPYPSWPRENAATRKRLRELCKRKPSLSAHYQRLLSCRTPSPQPSSPRSRARSASRNLLSPMKGVQPSFSTRDMNISLVSSTASSMMPGNPLQQLATEAPIARSDNDYMGPFASRLNAHQKSQSLNLSSEMASRFMARGQETLGSPFQERPSFLIGSQSMSKAATRESASPLELHAPVPLPRSYKRRALCHLEDASSKAARVENRENLLQELFGAPAETSHRRVRSRGFSLGDMSEGARRLSSLFCPPESAASIAEEPSSPFLQVPQPTNIMRLGSPFGGHSANFNNTFPKRNANPQLFEPAASFEERLSNYMA